MRFSTLVALPSALTLVTAAAGAPSGEASSALGGMFAGMQWPWSSAAAAKSIADIPIPGRGFETDISVTGPRCLWATLRLSSKFDLSCYKDSKSLYFTSPGRICSSECLDNTIRMSKYLVDECALDKIKSTEPNGYNHKNTVYLSWANKDISNLVCNGPSPPGVWSDPGQCYSTIFAIESVRESDGMRKDGVGKELVCNECSKQWVEKLGSTQARISPILYYGHIPDANRLATWVSEQCGYAYSQQF
ncbi:hypothetical protein GQ54DRAFT_308588 [Martensiomyces pterosporus]|nr:hypothetical protein GQ54DRAFT_308588 [Martensiomyces pterosporus]